MLGNYYVEHINAPTTNNTTTDTKTTTQGVPTWTKENYGGDTHDKQPHKNPWRICMRQEQDHEQGSKTIEIRAPQGGHRVNTLQQKQPTTYKPHFGGKTQNTTEYADRMDDDYQRM
eukprot:3163623-Prorocentrum_lima.AAC.1